MRVVLASVEATMPFVDGPIVRTATGFDKRGAEIGCECSCSCLARDVGGFG
jgi:hypothetical protein